MRKFILGKKLGMTTIHGDKGAQNVTLVECGSKISHLRTMEKDGYRAVQVEFPKTKKRSLKREFRIDNDDTASFKIGEEIAVSIFEVGEKVKVSGVSKAKGFQGVVKRHGFAGAPATHGHKHDLRAPGSIGAGYPEHVIKGKRMAGRMGGERATSMNLEVALIDEEKKIIAVKGAVPGIPGAVVEIYSK